MIGRDFGRHLEQIALATHQGHCVTLNFGRCPTDRHRDCSRLHVPVRVENECLRQKGPGVCTIVMGF